MAVLLQTAVQAGIPKLYHYEPFCPEYLKDILANRRVHFSSPRNFNDPWDCKPAFSTIRANDFSYQAKWIRLFGEQLNPTFTATQQRKETSVLHSHTVEIIHRTLPLVGENVWRNNEDRWRIYCLTPHPDTLLMWSHYADKHRGICLEFQVRPPTIARACRVMYSKTAPVLDPLDMTDEETARIILSKSWDWHYEDEYRILARVGGIDSDPVILPTTDKDFLSIQKQDLAAIIVGCLADANAIRDLVKQYAPDLSVRQATRQIDSYKLLIQG